MKTAIGLMNKLPAHDKKRGGKKVPGLWAHLLDWGMASLGPIMNRVVWNEEFEVWFDRLERPFHFKTPFEGEEFSLLLVINDQAITAEEKEVLTTEIVKKGCRYVVCAGHNGTQWDDAIAMAYVCVDEDVEAPEEHFVMTSSFEDEKMSDIVPHFRRMATFDNFDSDKYLVVFLGKNPSLEKETIELVEEYFAL
jgi:hypothetical protein